MKILLSVDPEIPVPPVHYGGIERIVDGLAQEYHKNGHEVLLLAHPDSSAIGATQIIPWQGSSSSSKWDTLRNAFQLYRCSQQFQPQVIHSFSRLLYLYPVFAGTKIPVVQSYQRAISPTSTSVASWIAGSRLQLVACAAHMFAHLPQSDRWKAIYNFANTNLLVPPALNASRSYLAFLGRIEDIKGTYEAIVVAQRTGEQLIIAGNIPAEHQHYFEQYVRPHIDGEQIRYIGPVNDQQKLSLLQGAKALLFPIKWAEPFGIVMAESFACGTPVLGFNIGSVPEVIQSGVNGWVCQDIEEMVQAVGRISDLNHQIVQTTGVLSFSASVIAGQYLSLFEHLLSKNKK